MLPVTTNAFGPNPTNKYVTTYFRRGFGVSNPASVTNLMVSVQRDDGAVVYLNGAEIFRSNMPAGPIDYLTFASAVVGTVEETTFYSQEIDPSLLVNGTNVLAVEIHQANAGSSDIIFDLELSGSAFPPNQEPAVNAGADQTITLPAGVSLEGAVRDDGLPIPPGMLSFVWTQSGGPGTVTFGNANALKTTASFSSPGTYTVRLSASDGVSSAADELTVTVSSQAQSLRIESAAWTGGSSAPALRIRFTATRGLTYTVQYRDSVDAGSWLKLTDVPSQSDISTVEVTDSTMTNSTARYYRIVTPQQP